MNAGNLDREATVLLRFSALLLAITLVFSLTAFAALWDLEKSLLIGAAVGALMVLLLPALLPKIYEVFQPLSFVILSVFVGVTGRTLYLLVSSSDKVSQLLLGRSPEFLLPAAFSIFVGLGFFVIGYMFPLPKLPLGKLRIAKSDRWNAQRLYLIIALYTLLSVVGTIMFLRETGFNFQDLTEISSKRFVRLQEPSPVEYTSLGHLRWVASLGQIAFLLFFTWFIRFRRSWISLAGLTVIVLFFIAAFFPFVTSSRGSLLSLALSCMIIWHYLRRAVSVKTVLTMALLALMVLSVMLSLRRGADNPWQAVSPAAVAESVFGSRDFLDVTTTAFIIEAVQEGRLTPSYGITYFTWLFAPIPRIVWPKKPVISVGWQIKRVVFGFGGRGGIPPGLIGEAYWAFGMAGVIVISFLIGTLAGLLYRSFRRQLPFNANMTLIYATIVLPWSRKVLGGSWSLGIVGTLQDFVPLLLALYFVTDRALFQEQYTKGA